MEEDKTFLGKLAEKYEVLTKEVKELEVKYFRAKEKLDAVRTYLCACDYFESASKGGTENEETNNMFGADLGSDKDGAKSPSVGWSELSIEFLKKSPEGMTLKEIIAQAQKRGYRARGKTPIRTLFSTPLYRMVREGKVVKEGKTFKLK